MPVIKRKGAGATSLATPNSNRVSIDSTRTWLALSMVVVGVSLLVIVSVVALVVPQGGDKRLETTRLIFAAVVPLIGTWVGTVLAFYFTSDNLRVATESQRVATESTLSLVSRLAPSTPVTKIMIPVAQIDPKLPVADDAEAHTKTLDELYTLMRDKDQSRLPIFDASTVALYVVHEADIDKYAAGQPDLAVGHLGPDHTLATLLAVPELAQAVKAFTAISTDAVVGDARVKMNADPSIKDLFVTIGGTTTTQALGWITNSDLARVD